MGNDFQQWVTRYVPSALAALTILVVGWLVALLLASIARNAVRRTNAGATLASWLNGEEQKTPIEVETWAGKFTYYFAMFFVLVAFFQSLGLTFIAEPLRGFLNQIFAYAPRVIGAAVLLIVALFVAKMLRMLVIKTLNVAKIDERFAEPVKLEEGQQSSLVGALGNVVYWLVFLFFLPAILTSLALEGLLVPVQDMLVVLLGFIPNLIAAFLILIAGWLGSRILQRLASKLTAALGVDRLSDNTGFSTVLGEQKLSGLIGMLAYALVLVFAIIAALNALALEAITAPASNMLGIILAALPSILAAILVLTIAYFVGKLLSSLLTNTLTAAGFNNILQRLGFASETMEGKRTPSEIVGYLALVAVILFAAIEAAGLLGFALLANLIVRLIVNLGGVAVGLAIFGIGLYLANVAHETVFAGGGPQADILARLAKVVILFLSGVMALTQMGIAQEIIIIGFSILFGAIALTAVIAFGVGGRDLAAREMEKWLDKFKSK